MKLRLSCWAEDLPVTDGLFCVLTVLHKEYGVKPTVLGQSEVLSGTHSPDWTKTFYLDDYEMGHETHLVVSLYRGRNVAVGSTLFEVGQVLGHAGSLAKQLKDGGGIVAVHIEESGNQSSGQLYLHLRGVQLKNMDGFGLLNKSDPFVELQRARLTTTGKSVWDAVYRSTALDNTLDPLFPEIFMDLEDLLGTTAALAAPTATDFRIAIYDWEKSGKHGLIGACIVNINDLMSRVDVTALQGVTPVALEKAIILKNTSNKETGKLIVVQADATGTPSVPVASSIAVPIIATGTSVPTAAVEALDTGVEAEISLADTAVSTDELVATDAGDLGRLRPTFCNYMAGGCQLRVTIAIDSTASNGDPRQDSSLHYFCGEGLNRYEQALQGICSIMTKYDSDQKYPVYGFGAKRDGVIRHCFPFSTTNTSAEVEGVEGILQIYREVFRSGIVMSSPRDFSEVIRSTGTNAKNHFVEGLSYSIVLIFTNGSPLDGIATKLAIDDAADTPMSIVFIGIGKEEDLNATKQQVLDSNKQPGRRQFLTFVHFQEGQNVDLLTEAALHDIPTQLESYFLSKEIYPLLGSPTDDVAVLPYNPASDIAVPMEINSVTGQVVVTEDVKPPETTQTKRSAFGELKKLGTKLKSNKLVGKLTKKLDKNTINMAKGKISQLIGKKLPF